MSEVHLISADARRLPLPDESVQCIVTSPPYWGLRKYAGEQELIWRAHYMLDCPIPESCQEHEFDGTGGETPDIRTGLGLEKLSERYRGGGHKQKELCTLEFGPKIISASKDSNRGSMEWTTGGDPAAKILGERISQGGFCIRCGAWRGAYGLEPTIEMYVAHTVEILRELRRVLRKDGVLFWNIGDSYAGGGNYRGMTTYESLSDKQRTNRGAQGLDQELGATRDKLTGALKAKDLCLIPERVALAAQADGWWVRSRILWCKPNPMPESVRDRPTDAAEHIWMFTKSERYFFDAEAVSEPSITGDIRKPYAPGQIDARGDGHDRGGGSETERDGSSRNIRNVWEFATQPYAGAHFATFPEEIPRRCILATTSERGACPRCASPWKRILKKDGRGDPVDYEGKWQQEDENSAGRRMLANLRSSREAGLGDSFGESQTIGWSPTCRCRGQHGKTVPSLVLDPFGGSGTTGRVAIELNRSAVVVDIAYGSATQEERASGRDYAALAKERTTEVQRRLPL